MLNKLYLKTNAKQTKTISNHNKQSENVLLKQTFSFSDLFFTIIIFLIMIIIILNPKKYSTGTIEGLKLFFNAVMPGLFPFMILTTILTELGIVEEFFSKFDKFSFKLFGTPGISIYVLFMSIISGYPIGAKIITELYQKNIITENEAKKMSSFCTTSGPSFVIGSIGTIMFNSHKIGVIIYISHIISSILIGIIFNIFSRKKTKHSISRPYISSFNKNGNIISYSISKTINSLFMVGAYITIFFLIGDILETLKFFNLLNNIISPVFLFFHIDTKYILGLLYGILEVTRGAKTLSTFSDTISILITTFILSFSGLSIIFQSMNFLKEAKIKAHTFIFYKCVHAIFSVLICSIFLMIL